MTMTLDGRLLQAMRDPTTPAWAQRLIRDTITRDAVDVANVLEALTGIYRERAREAQLRNARAVSRGLAGLRGK